MRIYYGDGTIWEGEGKPPSRDVQVILQRDSQVGYYLETGKDFYVLRDGIWLGVDIFGLFDYLMDSGVVLFGRTINNDEYRDILKQAAQELTDKNAWHVRDRKIGNDGFIEALR